MDTGSQHSGADEEPDGGEVPLRQIKIAVREQRFQRQIQLDVFIEGIKRFLMQRGKLSEEVYDKSQLKKLIIPFDYNAPSRAIQKKNDLDLAFKQNTASYPYLFKVPNHDNK